MTLPGFHFRLPSITSRKAARILFTTLTLLLVAVSSGCWLHSMTQSPRLQPVSNGTPRSVETGAIRFEEVAAASGLTYRYPMQPRPMRNLESFGCGCAALDYDDDGWMDILLVTAPHPILYHNRGNGTFEEVTSNAGLDKLKGEWKGCAVGDYDSDGRLDILLTGFHCLALLRNLDGHRFADVTVQAGLDPANHNRWGSSAGFMDLDGSGHLALVLLNYAIFGPNEPQYCELFPGIRSGCPPSSYKPEFPELWKNLGNGRFQEVTAGSGLNAKKEKWALHGKTLVIAFTDYDSDGRMDFYIGNDGTPASLLHNEGKLHFKNVAVELGIAFGVNQQAQASMGADWADYDRDGKMDLVTTAFSDEAYSLYHFNGFYFENVSVQMGIAEPTRKPLGFGTKFLDVDNDGFPDIVFANGHVYDNVDRIDSGSTFRQPTLLFHNQGGKHFESIGASAGEAFRRPILGRGLATADFDHDGRVDILIVDYEGTPLLLHNVSAPVGHWVELQLHGTPPNRFAYGAKVTVRSGKEIWVGEVSPASSYLSSSSPVLHFGLGAIERLDSVEVRWPDQKVETFSGKGIDRILQIEEGKGRSVSRSPAPNP